MATRHPAPQAARRPSRRAHANQHKLLYRRPLRYEPLEDRQLLALVTVDTPLDTVDLDDDLTSLREAIFATNLVSGPDEIRFDFGHDGPETIVLTKGELRISDDLTITGPGANFLTIDASGNDATPDIDDGQGSRIFNLNDATEAFINVSVAGLTLTGGDVTGDGGAILAYEAVYIDKVNIVANAAGSGGGVAAVSAQVSISKSNLKDNVARNSSSSLMPVGGGGGAYILRGTAVLSESTLSGNRALIRGGGIFSHNATTTLSNCSIVDNFANRFGGGLDGIGGQVSVNASIVSDNSLNPSSGLRGAGIRFSVGSLNVTDSVVSGNRFAISGGGINSSGTLTVKRSTISDHTVPGTGGGIFSFSGLTMTDSSIVNNSAAEAGGLAVQREFTIHSSTISDNSGLVTVGGVLLIGGEGTITLSSIVNNFGGGLFVGSLSNVEASLTHVIVARNNLHTGPDRDIRIGLGAINASSSLIGYTDASGFAEAPVGSPDANGNLIGGPVHGEIDPVLGPLANNGGPTMTHALLPGSPAINAGDLNAKAGEGGVPLYDQRGEPFSRVVNGRIDIGAFEYQAPSDLNLLVDTLEDETDGNHGRRDLSLREAIQLANLYPSDDTIRFDPALTAAGPATILLTRGELRITDDVSIKGLGANLLRIDASGSDLTPDIDDGRGSRVFNIDDGLRNSRIDVSISGLTLSGGDVSNVGGGIRSLENVAVLESIISGNASGPFGQGGGIYSDIGNLTIIDSQVLNNRAGFGGGGLYIRNGEASIIGSTIAGNVILGLQRTGIGVGIHSRNANLAIANSTISGNSGIGNAGLYAISAGRIEISNSQFLDNYYGVAIFSAEGTIDIRGSNVAQNDLHGVRLRIVDHVNVSITDTSVSDNLGGGIYAEENDGALAIVDCVVSGNGAGGIFAESSLNGVVEISNSTIAGNTTPFSGAGVDLRGGTVTIARSSIYDNVARGRDLGGYGGGGIHSNFAKVTISDSSIHNNSSQFPGGGISARGNLAVIRSQVTGNTATREGGGIWSRGYALIDRTTIANNSADYGGGIRGGELTITDSNIVRNSAHGLERLWPNSGNGGGVFGTGLIAIANSLIDGNSAAHHGGGIRAFLTGTTVSNSTVSNNSAEEGGGVFGPAVISQSTISSNTAEVGAGLHTGYARVTNSTISFNRAEILGAGIFITANSLTLDHSIVASNIGPYNGIVGLLGAIINARYSVIGNALGSGLAEAPAGSPDANGNLIGGPVHGPINPRLGPLAYNGGATPTHALLSGSPAIDAGDPAAMAGVGGVPQFDQRGEPFTRVYGGRIDIGAFEAQPNPLTGDYNFNGVVDTADVVIWRKTRNRSGDLRADGNGDGVVNDADWQVWRENFGRTAESEEQGAGSVEQEAVAAPPQRPAWQPPASPGVSVAAPRAAFRPATQRFAPDDELLASVAMPLARWQGRKEFIPARRQLTGDTIDAASDPSVGVIDRVFETLGADLAGSRPSVARRLLAQT